MDTVVSFAIKIMERIRSAVRCYVRLGSGSSDWRLALDTRVDLDFVAGRPIVRSVIRSSLYIILVDFIRLSLIQIYRDVSTKSPTTDIGRQKRRSAAHRPPPCLE
jgi:hypothetical protein